MNYKYFLIFAISIIMSSSILFGMRQELAVIEIAPIGQKEPQSQIKASYLKRLPAAISRLYEASTLESFKDSAQDLFNHRNDYPELKGTLAGFDANTPINEIAFALAAHFGIADMAKKLHKEGVVITTEMWNKAADKNFKHNDGSMFRVLGDVDRLGFMLELVRLKSDPEYVQFNRAINILLNDTRRFLGEAEELKKGM